MHAAKIEREKEGEDDEATYLRKLEEIKKKKSADNSMHALIMQENKDDDEFGSVEVWSTDSEDGEVCMPNYCRSFFVKAEDSHLGAKCFMVTDDASQM